MKKINKHIIIVRSSIKELSSMSQLSCDALLTLLAKHYETVGVCTVNNIKDLEAVESLKPDLLFLGMQAIPVVEGENITTSSKIWLSEYFDKKGILYTGSSAGAHEFETDKSLAKQQIQDAGLNTSAFFVVGQNAPTLESSNLLTFPLFVKPTSLGGGIGIDSQSVVHNLDELNRKVTALSDNYNSESLVEEYLDGREFSVAILKNPNGSQYMAMPLELVAPEDEFGSRILSENVKNQDTETFCEITDLTLKNEISTLAKNIFKVLGARDYGRIDIRLDNKGVPQFLEANLIPSLIENYGNFPKACWLNNQINYEGMILRIVNLGFARKIA